jgi:signal transduction histidine kinase/DNA-binding NarL/FixJ family response regulator
MTVFNTEMHIVTFLITVFESAMLFFAVIWYLQRTDDDGRLRYVFLLILLIQYNVFSGLFPDPKININLQFQTILAYWGGISVSMFIVYYIYKTSNLQALKYYAIQGSILFLLLPFVVLFIVPYMITGDAELSRKLVVIMPIIFSFLYVYALTRALWKKYREATNRFEREEIIGFYVSLLLWATLPTIVFFNASQLIENSITNTGFMIMSVLFIRSAIFTSRKDYDELQKSKIQLEQSNALLQEKVKARTRELELANEKRLNSFINLMHETKTPLTLINNCLDELIVKVGNSEEADMARTGLEKLNQNMSNFFDLNKLERGMHIYDHTVISDFSEIVHNIVPLFQSWAGSKHIKISAEIEDDVFAMADPQALSRIIDNLLENAIKYSDQGGQILLGLKQDEEHVNLLVKDEGPGISKADREKIFEPYFQVDHKKKNVQGMGMGLAMVKRTVDSLGGAIHMISDIGRGTEVVVEIPVCNIDINQPIGISSNDFNQSIRHAEYEVADKVVSEARHNILIIEDQQDFLYLLHKNMCKNYNVYVAKNGLVALKKLEKMPVIPDLIVSDIMMDEMDGFAFVKAMRKQRRFQHIPIIFTTAISEEEKRLNGLKLGAVDFIVKPFSIDELKLKIESILEIHEQQRIALIQQASVLIKNGNSIRETTPLSWEDSCKKFNLTNREIEVLKHSIEGKTRNEIADTLFISAYTVAKHISNIYEKLNVKNKIQLIKLLDESF